MPVDDLVSNWAYMVMACLAWSLKAWTRLAAAGAPRCGEVPGGEAVAAADGVRTFCVAMIQVPCQIVRSGGRLIYRLLSWNPWQGVFLRLVERLHGRRLC